MISRNEGEEGKELFTRTVSISEKAHSLLRVIVVSKGMSVCEDGMIGNTLQSDGTRIAECRNESPIISNECSEFR